MTVQISSKLEKRLREKAEKEGINIDHLVNRLLEERFPPSAPGGKSKKEAALLKKISQGFSEDFWSAYFGLIEKRDTYQISPTELELLIGYSEKLEKANTERLKYLIELANLRDMDLDDLINELGIRPRSYA